MHLPLNEMPYWLRGNPSSFHEEHTELDEQGRVIRAYVQGWQLEYGDYEQGSQLPSQVVATQDDKRIRLIVLDWEG